jgi:hypothetical protein
VTRPGSGCVRLRFAGCLGGSHGHRNRRTGLPGLS